MNNQIMTEAENIRKELQKIPHLVYHELMLLLADDVKEAKDMKTSEGMTAALQKKYFLKL